jgi:hypothetical protein
MTLNEKELRPDRRSNRLYVPEDEFPCDDSVLAEGIGGRFDPAGWLAFDVRIERVRNIGAYFLLFGSIAGHTTTVLLQ